MTIGEKLLELRKKKQLSQEEVAYKLNVTRQTISKWETDQSTPDFDKIAPICELYEVTADELLTGYKKEEVIETEKNNDNKKRKAIGIGIGVFLYFISVVWVMIAIPVMMMNPIIASAFFLLICGLATLIIVYTCIVYKEKEEEKAKKEKEEPELLKQINTIINTIILIIYLVLSFATMAWHITWILWVISGLLCEIVKLIFMLRGDLNEK